MDINDLYFVITHKNQIKQARMFMGDEFLPIYRALDGYEDVVVSYPGFKNPYMGSYQKTSNHIVQAMVAQSTDDNNSMTASVWTTRSQSTKGSRNGIVIDYNDFSTLKEDEPAPPP